MEMRYFDDILLILHSKLSLCDSMNFFILYTIPKDFAFYNCTRCWSAVACNCNIGQLLRHFLLHTTVSGVSEYFTAARSPTVLAQLINEMTFAPWLYTNKKWFAFKGETYLQQDFMLMPSNFVDRCQLYPNTVISKYNFVQETME